MTLMKKLFMALPLALLCFSLPAGAAQLNAPLEVKVTAQPSGGVALSTNLPGSGGLTATTSSVTPSGLDFTVTNTGAGSSGASLNTSITVTVTQGVSYKVALDGGRNVSGGSRNLMLVGGSHLIPYKLYQDSAGTIEWGDGGYTNTYSTGVPLIGVGTNLPQIFNVYGGLAGSLAGAPFGNYADSVSVILYY